MAPEPRDKVERTERSSGSLRTGDSGEKNEKDVEKGDDASPTRADFNERAHSQAPRSGSLAALTQSQSQAQKYTDDGKRIMQEEDCWDQLGYQWPSWKKVKRNGIPACLINLD